MTSAPPLDEDHRLGILGLLAAGSLGMIALGTIEVWSGRARGHVDADSGILWLLLGVAPISVMISTWLLAYRRLSTRGTPALAVGGRLRSTALAGWVLLTVAAVLLLQAVLFGASSALVQEIGCGHAGADWCGFGSGIFGAIAVAVGGTVGMIGAALWLVTRRRAALVWHTRRR